jgi:hypothetical protein
MTTDYVIRDGQRIEVETLPSRVTPRRRRAKNHIGCPVEWLKRVFPLMNSKEQLVIAIWLHRRRIVCGSDLFTVPNNALEMDLGLGRQAKYRTLRHLEKVKIIAIARNGKRSLRVKLL